MCNVYTLASQKVKGRHMGKDKKKKKEAQLVIRLEKDERDAFVELCAALDTTAAREIRHFMRRFVEQKGQVGD